MPATQLRRPPSPPRKGFNHGLLEPCFRKRCGQPQPARGNDPSSSNLTNDARQRDVRKDVARVAGVSTGNVTKVKQILDSVISRSSGTATSR